MKKLFVGLFFAVVFLIFILSFYGWKNQEQTIAAAKNLPWQISTTDAGNTKVFGVEIGKSTFKELMHELKRLAEPALFESPDGDFLLEASFGKKKIGLLEARLVAELDADRKIMEAIKLDSVKREATPSNQWKYIPSVKSIQEVINNLRVWRLIYLPVSDYDEKQIEFFGEPKESIKINETAQYLLFPEKGLVVLWDTAGKEIFYYAAPKDFERLKKRLPTKRVMTLQ